jgi:hypothetical protein
MVFFSRINFAVILLLDTVDVKVVFFLTDNAYITSYNVFQWKKLIDIHPQRCRYLYLILFFSTVDKALNDKHF